jgi:hypothetical protein
MIKKITLAAFCLLTTVSTVFCQYTLDWQQNASMDPKKPVMSAVDSFDNVIVTGYLQSYRMFTRKYSISGALLWEVEDSTGIQSIYEKPNWVTCDSSNNILVVGHQYSLGSSYEYPNAIVALKYSQAGTLLWRTVIPISILINSTTSFACRGVVDVNCNLYIGTAITNGATLIKLDTNGNVIFTNSSISNAPKNFNGMRIRNNKIALATSSGTPNVAPVFVWDTAGVLLWTANATGALASDVEIDENDNVYVLGSIYHMISAITWDYDAKLTKYNSTGTLLWTQNYDFGGYNFTTRMTYVNGRISAIGYGNASGLKWQTFQTDTNGTLLWSSPYTEPTPLTASDSYPHYVLAKPSGEVIVTGVGGPTPDPFNPSYNQMPIVQYSNTGVQNWLSTPNYYAGTGLAIQFASDGSLFAIGSRNMFVFHYNIAPASIHTVSEKENLLAVFPVAFTSILNLSFTKFQDDNAAILISDVLGKEVKSMPMENFQLGKNEILLDLSSLTNGIYFITQKSNTHLNTVKVIKY